VWIFREVDLGSAGAAAERTCYQKSFDITSFLRMGPVRCESTYNTFQNPVGALSHTCLAGRAFWIQNVPKNRVNNFVISMSCKREMPKINARNDFFGAVTQSNAFHHPLS
jgi:hypothetical protein